MNKEKIEKIILTLLPNADLESSLIGNDSILDSLGLVNLIVDIETIFESEGIRTSIVSEKAMSLNLSPFKTVQTLVNFIYELCNNRNE